jgi:biotin operon repressor
MRRADRLFQIIQVLRRARRPLTAEAIAAELETSKRTVYRDIATLMAQRVPIRGEAGIGYVLEGGFDLPPLMLTPDEIEAAVLGAQWVIGWGDPVLARAAQDLLAKIGAAVPERLRPFVHEPGGLPAARLEEAARGDGHGAAARLDPHGPQDRAQLPRRAGAREPAHGLALPGGLSRDQPGAGRPGASCAATSACSAPIG